MTFTGKIFATIFVLSSVSITAAGEKDHPGLSIGPASSYAYKQTSEGVTIAAEVFETGEKVKEAFGKHNPYDYGVLPVLVVIENHGPKAIRLDRMEVQYEMPGHGRVDATPAQDLKYLHPANPGRPQPSSIPIPGLPGGISRSKKNPLSDWEIEGRAFVAKVVPPNETVSGFFYFQTGHRSNSSLYISGLEETGTGKQLLYFEIPLGPVAELRPVCGALCSARGF